MRKPPMDDCGAKKAVSIPEEQIRPCRDRGMPQGRARRSGDILAAAHFGVENGFYLVGEVFQMVIWKIMSSPSTER